MPRDTSTRLVEYASGQVDDALRTVAVLEADGCEVVFLRDDLQEAYSPAQYKRVAESFRTDLGMDTSVPGGSPVGEKRSVVHYHDRAFVFQFPHEDCHSILLSVEPTVGSRLRSFIEGCEQRL